jgi:flagella basal body P-ring formation protein FlgA
LKYVVLILILAFSTFSSAKMKELRFRPYTKMSGQEQIMLGDIIENKADLSGKLAKLKKLALGDTPLLGEERVFSSQFISQILRKHIDGQLVSVRIPNRIVVANKGFELNESAMERKLLNEWKKSCKDCRIFIRSLTMPKLAESFAGRPWVMSIKPGLPRGAFTEKVFITGSDNRKNTFWVSGQIEVQKKVPVTARSLNSQARVMPEDFRYEWRDVTYATDGTLNENDLLGQSVKFGIPSNQIIWANSVARQKAVRRGDLVKVISGEGSWQVTLRAVTEQDGFVGDRVNIRNVNSKKIITGEVVGPGEVAIQ